MYDELLLLAKEKIASVDETVAGFPAPHVTVLVTERCTYYAFNDLNGKICDTLAEKCDTQILRLITVFQSGAVDIAPYKLRQALVELDVRNSNADVILQGLDGLKSRKLIDTLP